MTKKESPLTDEDIALITAQIEQEGSVPDDPEIEAMIANAEADMAGRGFNPSVESILQGLTLGTSDEIQAALGAAADKVGGLLRGAPVDWSDQYALRQAAIQRAINQHAQDYPLASGIGNLSGGLLTGSQILTKAGPALQGLGVPMGWAQKIPRLIKYPLIGGSTGYLSGMAATDPSEESRASGGVFPAVLGTGVGILGAGTGMLADRFLQKPATLALRKLKESLERDAVTPQRAAARLARGRPSFSEQGGRIADVGGSNVRLLAQAAYSQPGPARNSITNALFRRDRKQAERLVAPLERLLGNGKRLEATFDELRAMREQISGPLYQSVESLPVEPTAVIRSLAVRPAIKTAIANARRVGLNKGQPLPDSPDDFTLADWNQVKIGLDDSLYGIGGKGTSHIDPITKKLITQEGRGIKDVSKELLGELDKQIPGYKLARDAYSGPTASMEAAERGSRFLRQDADITVKELQNLSSNDRAFFRLGVAQALRNMVEAKKFTHDSSKIFDSPAMQRKLQAVFPTRSAYLEFVRTLKREAKMAQTKGITGGSQTAERLAAQQDLGGDTVAGIATDVAAGNVGQATQNIVRGVSRFAAQHKLSPKTSRELSEILFTKDPAEQQRILSALSDPPPPSSFPGFVAAASTGADTVETVAEGDMR